QRDRMERQSGGVDDDACHGVAGFVQPVDQLRFGIGLAEIDLEAVALGALDAALLDVGQCLLAVDIGLADAEQIEIGSVQNQHRSRHFPPPSFCWLTKSLDKSKIN